MVDGRSENRRRKERSDLKSGKDVTASINQQTTGDATVPSW